MTTLINIIGIIASACAVIFIIGIIAAQIEQWAGDRRSID